MSIEQKLAILRLLPKGEKDTKAIKFLRPISLLNTSYKIYAKVLSNRLEPSMKKLIDPAQNTYIKKRNIGHNIRNIADLIDFANKTKNIAFVLFADFEKAFDSVSWTFLFKIMHKLEYGERFINYIKIA